jgi:hypothetical protein
VHSRDLGNRPARLFVRKAHSPECQAYFFEDRSCRRFVSSVLLGATNLRRLLLAKVPATCDPIAAKCLLRPELIVSAAANTEIASVVGPAEGLWLDVIELEEGSGVTAAPVFGNERALKAVAFVDLAARRVRDAGGPCHAVNRFAPSPLSSSETLSFEFGEQKVHSTLDDHAEIATRIRMAHEVTAKLELVSKLGACREFDPKAHLGQRVDAC